MDNYMCGNSRFMPHIKILCEDLITYVLDMREGTDVNPPVRVYLTISIISLHSRVTVGKLRIFQSLFQSFLFLVVNLPVINV